MFCCRKLDAWDAANPAPTVSAIKDREELEKQLSALKTLQKTEDLGPLYDVIAFHDGSVWRAALDASEVQLLSRVSFLLPLPFPSLIFALAMTLCRRLATSPRLPHSRISARNASIQR